MSEGISVTLTDGVARLRLDRPASANALDLATARALRSAVAAIDGDDEARAVLLTGAGPHFCAGGDVVSMVGAQDRAAYVEELATVVDEALQALDRMAKPVVAAVHGAVAGAGLAVMLSCDLVVAETSTTFVAAYAGVGLTPDCGLSWLLPRVVGQQRALELLLSLRTLDAATARDWGLVTEIAERGGADERAASVASALAAGPSFALGQTRALVRGSWTTTRDAAGRREAEVIGRAVQTPEATDRLARFTRR